MNWGTWGANLSASATAQLIDDCVEIGVSTFDQADIYGHHTTESDWGAGFTLAQSKREDIKLITKCGIMMPSPARPQIKAKHYDTSGAHIIASVDQSLTNLKTDYIDLLLIHRPSPLMDPAVIAHTISSLIKQGKLLHFGVSNFTNIQIDLLREHIPVEANQIEISHLALQSFTDGSLDKCMLHHITPQAWSPLGGGKLFSSLSKPQDLERRSRLLDIADKYNWELDYMIYLFLLHHPANIQVVTGSSKFSRIKSAHQALQECISDAQWFEIYTACQGKEVA